MVDPVNDGRMHLKTVAPGRKVLFGKMSLYHGSQYTTKKLFPQLLTMQQYPGIMSDSCIYNYTQSNDLYEGLCSYDLVDSICLRQGHCNDCRNSRICRQRL